MSTALTRSITTRSAEKERLKRGTRGWCSRKSLPTVGMRRPSEAPPSTTQTLGRSTLRLQKRQRNIEHLWPTLLRMVDASKVTDFDKISGRAQKATASMDPQSKTLEQAFLRCKKDESVALQDHIVVVCAGLGGEYQPICLGNPTRHHCANQPECSDAKPRVVLSGRPRRVYCTSAPATRVCPTCAAPMPLASHADHAIFGAAMGCNQSLC